MATPQDTGWQDLTPAQAAPQQNTQPAVQSTPQKLSADDTGWQDTGTPSVTAAAAPKPSALDVANEFYKSDPNASVVGKVGRSLGRTALMIPNVLHTALGTMTDEEKQAHATAGGGLQGLAAVEAKRFLYDPSEASWNHMHNLAEAGRQRIEASRQAGHINDARAKELLSSLQAYEKAGKALSAIPLFGPIAAGLGEQAGKGDVAGTLTDILAPAAIGEAVGAARGVGRSTPTAIREGVQNTIRERVTPTTEVSPRGAEIPVRSDTGLGNAAAAAAPEEAAKFAQTRTAPAIQQAVGGTVGEATGSGARTTITPEDRMGLKGHANDLIENQARPAFKRIDELTGNKLTDAQNKISSGWSQMDKAKIAEGELEKSTLYDNYRETLKSEGLDIDEAERNYARGKAVERMAKRLDTATGPSNVEGAPYELDGKKLMKVVDDGVKNGAWKRMGLTDEHIGELQSLAKTAAKQTELPKVNAMVRGLGRLAVWTAGLHGGVFPAIEAVSGVSAADYIGNKIAKHVMQDAMMNYDASQAMNEAIRTGDNTPVVDALSKNPDWVARTKDYVKDTVKRLFKGEAGEAGKPGTVFEPHEIEELKRLGMSEAEIADLQQPKKTPPAIPVDEMHKAHLANGGATFDQTGNLSGKDAWSVGAYPERTESIPDTEFSPERIKVFTEKNADLLSKENHAVGSWKDTDNGQNVLDVTRLVNNDAEAKAIGAAANQKSIYHLKRGELANTGGTGEVPTSQMNASGESSASLEAQSRLQSQQTAGLKVYDVDSRMASSPNAWHPVMASVDRVDQTAQPFHHLVQLDPKTGQITVLDSGKGAQPLPLNDRIQAILRQAGAEEPRVDPRMIQQAQYRAGLRQKEIATRYPSSVGATGVNDPAQQSGLSALNEADKMSPSRMTQAGKPVLGVKQKLVAALSEYKDNGVSHLLNTANPDAAIEKYVTHLKDNLKWLHGVTPESIRNVAHQWYESAHDTTRDIAEKNGISHEQSAAVTAALSPKNDWNNNIGQAKRLIEHFTNDQNHAWTPAMGNAVSDIQSSEAVSYPLKKALEELRGKRYTQLTAKSPEALLAKKALWMRVLDEAHGGSDTPIYSPNGTVAGSQTMNWGQVEPMAKALSILENGSVENIHRVMGQGHKIRNFYNNIINPWSDRGHVTVDTHAVGAGLLKPFSQDDTEVAHNFGSGNKAGTPSPAKHAATGVKGSYSVHEEAYKRAAQELGIQPRQLQSITWEGIRSLMGDEKKTPELRRAVNNIWRAHEMGELTLDQARQEIIKASGGFSKPTWMTDENWEQSGGEQEGQTDFAFGANQGGQ